MIDPQNPSPVRCALYLRSAIDDRASLLWQEEACRAAAAEQNPPWQVVEDAVFTDAGTFGSTSHNRPGLTVLMQKAAERSRSFDIVLVESSHRLGRNLIVVSEILDALNHQGVGIYVASLRLYSRSPSFRDFLSFSTHNQNQMSRAHGTKVHRGHFGVLAAGGSVGGAATATHCSL